MIGNSDVEQGYVLGMQEVDRKQCGKAEVLAWCKSIKDYVNTLTARHGAVYALRVDLMYPDGMCAEDIHPDNSDFTKFIKYVDRAVSKKERGFLHKRVGHIAFREFGEVRGKKHYHAVLFFRAVDMLKGNPHLHRSYELENLLRDKWGVVSGNDKPQFSQFTLVTPGSALPCHWVQYLTKPKDKRKDGFSNLLKSNEKVIKQAKVFLKESPEMVKASRMVRKMYARKSKTLLISGTLHLPLNTIRMIEKSEIVQFLKELNDRLYDAGRGYLSGGVVALQHTTEKGLASFTVGLDGHKNGWSQVRDFISHRVHDIMLQSWHKVTEKGMVLVDKIHLIKPRNIAEEEKSKTRSVTKKVIGGMFEAGKKTVNIISRFFGSKKKKN